MKSKISKKSKKISCLLSLLMFINTGGVAAYAENLQPITSLRPLKTVQTVLVDTSLVEDSVNRENAEIKNSLERIDALIKAIETYKASIQDSTQNNFIGLAQIMIMILGLSSTAAHIKNIKLESSIDLTLAAVMGVLSTALQHYVDTQKIDMDVVKALLVHEQEQLQNSVAESANAHEADLISESVKQLAEIIIAMDDIMSDIKNNINSGQEGLAITAIVTLALNYAAPFLPNKIKTKITEKAPVFVARATETKKIGKQSLASTNIITSLSSVVGLASKSSQAQLEAILINLRVTQANLKTALKS